MNRGEIWSRFRSSHRAVLGLMILSLEILAVVFLPPLLGLDPAASDIHAGFFAPPSPLHPLGTDGAARDLLARTLCGGRLSLLAGLTAPLIGAAVGLPLGLAAGYYRGAVEAALMGAANVFMCLPNLFLALIVLTLVRPSPVSVVVVIGLVSWTDTAKLAHSLVVSIREQDYIASAVTIGESEWQILTREILPGVLSPVLASLSFQAGGAVLLGSALSYLGAGIPSPWASWGSIISAAQDISVLTGAPWVWVPSGTLIVLTSASLHFIGRGLRDALDPKMNSWNPGCRGIEPSEFDGGSAV